MIEAYINKVVSYLPFKQRTDIAQELDSIIRDMCHDDFSNDNIKKVLTQMGQPRDLALEYSEQTYLIGPQYFARFKELLSLVLRIALPVIFVITFITNLQNDYFISSQISNITVIITNIVIALFTALTSLIGAALSIFAVVTLVFVILEKTHQDIELNEYMFEEQPKPKARKSQNTLLFEGIMGMIGVIIGTFILFNPNLISLGYIDGISIILTTNIINPQALQSLIPIALLTLAIGFVIAIIKMMQRKESKTLYVIEIINSLAWILFVVVAMSIPDLINPEIMNTIATTANLSAETLSILMTTLNWVPAIMIVISVTDGIYNAYLLYKLNHN